MEVFRSFLATMDLDSPEAQTQRRQYEQIRRWEEEARNRPRLDPPPSERIQQVLERCERGEPQLWWCLARELTLTPESTRYGEFHKPDITTFHGWREASPDTRTRIGEAARQYILRSDDRCGEWIGKPDVFSLPAHAGYQALRLLYAADPEFVERLEARVWANWGAALMDSPLNVGGDEQETHHRALVALAYERAPDDVLDALEAAVRREASRPVTLSCAERIAHILDDRMRQRLLSIVDSASLPPQFNTALLSFLIEHDDPVAAARAFERLAHPFPSDAESQAEVMALAAPLGSSTDASHWPLLWKKIQSEPSFGRALVTGWCHGVFSLVTRLSDTQVADLYSWVARQYPPADDPAIFGAHETLPREEISRWRDGLLGVLKLRGTFSACAALNGLRDAFPETPWIGHVLEEAITLARSNSWRPLAPSEVLKLAADRNARVINNSSQLLDVLIESLGRLQAELQGPLPASRDLCGSPTSKEDVKARTGARPLSL